MLGWQTHRFRDQRGVQPHRRCTTEPAVLNRRGKRRREFGWHQYSTPAMNTFKCTAGEPGLCCAGRNCPNATTSGTTRVPLNATRITGELAPVASMHLQRTTAELRVQCSLSARPPPPTAECPSFPVPKQLHRYGGHHGTRWWLTQTVQGDSADVDLACSSRDGSSPKISEFLPRARACARHWRPASCRRSRPEKSLCTVAIRCGWPPRMPRNRAGGDPGHRARR